MEISEEAFDRAAVGVTGVAVLLLGSIALLAKRIAGNAQETEDALLGLRDNTRAFFEIPRITASIDRITEQLREMRD